MRVGFQMPLLAGTVVLEGALTPFGLGNVLQFVCSFAGDALICIERHGAVAGQVMIRGGCVTLVHAGDQRGEAAFYRLSQLDDAHFRVVHDADLERQASESSRTCTDLLLSAAVFEDEARRAAGHPPPLATPPSASPRLPELTPPTDVDLERMRASALTAYLHGDVARAQLLVERCLSAAPTDRRLRLLLERIKQGAQAR